MNSENFSQSLHIPEEFLLQKNGSIKEQSLKMSILIQFKKIYIFEMKMKNWIEWTNKMSKLSEKKSNANVLQIFAFDF